jgi:hypothetical protein
VSVVRVASQYVPAGVGGWLKSGVHLKVLTYLMCDVKQLPWNLTPTNFAPMKYTHEVQFEM